MNPIKTIIVLALLVLSLRARKDPELRALLATVKPTVKP